MAVVPSEAELAGGGGSPEVGFLPIVPVITVIVMTGLNLRKRFG